ncbi:MAG: FAD-binding oxidoreductase [Pseudopelagicola sp.]|nr:FAD-binding oxidoreductase [Pseudopelagicola sp.]
MKISGWGRYPVLEVQTHKPRDMDAVRDCVLSQPTLIARGNGRAYGDSAINPSATLDMRRLNRMLAFDPQNGQLVAEAGVLLGDIISAFLSRGWFLWVTPGTKFVTLGGAIAADVHGKNHHKDGSFRSSVDWIDLMGPDGVVRRCSRHSDPSLFDHTLGGMGLTGIILRAAIQLRPVESGWIRQTTIPTPNLKATIAAFETARDASYSVAWIDCLASGDKIGRSILKLGEHATRRALPAAQALSPFSIPRKRRLSVPVDLPGLTLNAYTLRAFNALYYKTGTRTSGEHLVDWDSYFYPLDAIHGWNRIYGRNGLAQFQCVLPLARSEAGLGALLSEIAKVGSGSFLAVLKRFGQQQSAFSFPMEGYTLALDFPVNPKTLALLERLDKIVLDHEGRFYLAKDSRMSAATLHASDPRVAAFMAHRNRHGLAQRFLSAQSERLSL